MEGNGAEGMSAGAELASAGPETDTTVVFSASADDVAAAMPAVVMSASAVHTGATKHTRLNRWFMALARVVDPARAVTSPQNWVSENGHCSFSDVRFSTDLSGYRAVSSSKFTPE